MPISRHSNAGRNRIPIPTTHDFAQSQRRDRAAETAGRMTPQEAVEAAVEKITDARRLFLDAAKDLDSIGETDGHRHLMALMASSDDCVDGLVRSEQS